MIKHSKCFRLHCFLLLFFCGCVRTHLGDDRMGLDGALAFSQFPDIPIPRNLKMVSENFSSWSFRRGGFRVGHFVYSGDATNFERFIRKRLPVHGWRKVSRKNGPDGGYVFVWEKNGSVGNKYLLKIEVKQKKFPMGVVFDLGTKRISF